jgi:uncharacterized repeat protein (TIGR03803 family)
MLGTKSITWKQIAALCFGCVAIASTALGQTVSFQTVVNFDNTTSPFGSFNSGFIGPTSLVQGRDGNLWGTTQAGGKFGPNGWSCNGPSGTIFHLNPPTETLSTVHTFFPQSAAPPCLDGQYPSTGLTLGKNGTFYGTTVQGGSAGLGTVFKSPGGASNVLYNFLGDANGSLPVGGLLQASDGNFYGKTSAGGQNGCGTLFKISGSGVLTTLYSFPAVAFCTVVGEPGNLIQATDGNLYGTARQGGDATCNCGFVFKVSLPTGVVSTLYNFKGGTSDGAYPHAGVVQGSDGNFYGTTESGGYGGNSGTIFKMTPSGQRNRLFRIRFKLARHYPDRPAEPGYRRKFLWHNAFGRHRQLFGGNELWHDFSNNPVRRVHDAIHVRLLPEQGTMGPCRRPSAVHRRDVLRHNQRGRYRLGL